MIKRAYMALFGNVALEKAYCPKCRMYAFVQDGQLQCCDTNTTALPVQYKRESLPPQSRRQLARRIKRLKLEQQGYCCFYCDRPFGAIVFRRGRPIHLHIEYDHQVPFSYNQDNGQDNFVAACHICNGIKSDTCFQTVEEAQVYLMDKWAQKGYTDDC